MVYTCQSAMGIKPTHHETKPYPHAQPGPGDELTLRQGPHARKVGKMYHPALVYDHLDTMCMGIIGHFYSYLADAKPNGNGNISVGADAGNEFGQVRRKVGASASDASHRNGVDPRGSAPVFLGGSGVYQRSSGTL